MVILSVISVSLLAVISKRLGGKIENVPRKNLLNFGMGVFRGADFSFNPERNPELFANP